MELLEQVQQRVRKMLRIKVSHEDGLMELGLFSLKRGQLRGESYQYL